jgi:glycosyltransferase involved in cell wall biosynthesis
MKTLSVVVPYFKETPAKVMPLLSSLDGQVGIDFKKTEVLLVNDGTNNIFDTAFLSMFRNLDIRTVLLRENGGPGVARQAGLDEAKGEYVMFCDADDRLHSVGVLGAVFEAVSLHAPDIVTGPWLEELAFEDGSYKYVTHQDEATWMHGKALRRRFVAESGVRFRDDLRVHEDSYFLGVLYALTDKIAKLPCLTYVWIYGEDSITRRDGAVYTFDSIPTFVRANGLVLEALEEKNPDIVTFKTVQFLTYMYFCLHRPEWLDPARKGFLEAAEAAVAGFLRRFGKRFDGAAKKLVAEVYNAERGKHFAGLVESELFDAWILRVREPAEDASEDKAEGEKEAQNV